MNRPTLTKTPGGYYYVTNAAGTGGRSFEPGKRGLKEAQVYYRKQVREYEEADNGKAA